MVERGGHIRDEILLLSCQQGDGTAFAELVQRWQPKLEAHARHVLGNADAARDIVQESWMAVIRELPRLRDVDAFPKWVFLIVSRRAVDWIRRQQRARVLAADYRDETEHRPPSKGPSEASDRLEQAMQALEPEQRALVALHYFEGFGIDELAEQMNLPPGTVKSRLFHARNRIRKVLEEPHNV